MKRRLVSILLCVVMIATIFAVVPISNVAEGSDLVALWHMDEGQGDTIHDQSGNDNDGTIYGATWTTGISGSALSFDGTPNTYVKIPDSDSLDLTGDYTIGFWINVREIPNQARILSKYDSSSSYSYSVALYDEGDLNGKFSSSFSSTGSDTGGAIGKVDGTTIAPIGNWYHVVVVHNGTVLTLYVNGQIDSKVSGVSDTVFAGTSDLYIGKLNLTNQNIHCINGTIDEVRIWNRALSAGEIEDYYDQMTTVAYWKFDEGSGNIADDSSSNNNHGTLNGDPQWVDGIQGKALEFDGVGDYIEVPDDPSLDITEGATIECWVKLNDFPGIYVYNIIGKGTSPIDRWRLDITSYGQSLRFITGGDILIEYEVNFMLNTWYYFAVTWDGQIAIMYMNGISVGSDSIGSFSNPPANIFISSEAGLKDYVKGVIDEVRIWNTALSSTKIWENYISRLPDLSINPDDITFSNSNPIIGETITISAKVYNVGTISGSADVKFWVGDPTNVREWIKESGIRIDIGVRAPNAPEVITLPDNTYRMFYGYAGGSNCEIHSSWSDDGINWIYEGRCFPIGGNPHETWADDYPSVIQLPDGSFRMYYSGHNYDNAWDNGHILSAWSPDGFSWIKENILLIDHDSYYDSVRVQMPNVIQLSNGTYRMYYVGSNDRSPTYTYILSAWSRNGMDWIKEGLRLSPGGPFDLIHVYAPEVIRLQDGSYRMYYTSSNNFTSPYSKILSARSSDGLEWEKEEGIRLSYSSSGYDEKCVRNCDIFSLENSDLRMYYQGYNNVHEERILSAIASPSAIQIGFNQPIILAPGESSIVSVPWTAPSTPGEYDIYVTIEDCTPTDSNLYNNIASKTITVRLIPESIDIEPNTINRGSEGEWITCYIELPEGYDVRDIDAATILLEDTLLPELDPKYGFVRDEESYIVDEDEDGIFERMVKFDRDDVEEMLSPGIYNLKVTGELEDGTVFEGYSDEIKVIDPP